MARFTEQGAARLSFEVPRISERVRARAKATWYPPSRRKLLGGRPQPVAVDVLDISITGALLLGPAHDGLKVGQRFQFEMDGERCQIEIRNIRPTSSASKHYYGVAFYRMNPQFETKVLALVASVLRPGTIVE